jgi:putative endopeptidase
MKLTRYLSIAILSSIAFVQSLAQVPKPAATAEDKPVTALPYTPGLDLPSMDKSADPCADFIRTLVAAG